MLCPCGGQFRPDGQVFAPQTSFEPYHDDRLGVRISSWRQAEREGRKRGLGMVNDRTSFKKECKKTLKNREDIIHSIYKKDGYDYPKGKKCNFDDTRKCFVDQKTKEPITKRFHSTPKTLRISDKIAKAAVFLMFLCATAFADYHIEGVKYVTLNVKGTYYDVPIHSPEFTEERAITVMKVLNGDKEARAVFLGGKETDQVFIGDGQKVRWLFITKDNEFVKEY